jgi:hypothetical protein
MRKPTDIAFQNVPVDPGIVARENLVMGFSAGEILIRSGGAQKIFTLAGWMLSTS